MSVCRWGPDPVPPFAGRDRELDLLARLLAEVEAGAARTVLIGGEAGIGKSRMLAEFTHRHAGSARVLSGACPDIGQIPYAPLIDVVRTLVDDLGVDAVRAAAGNGAAALELLLPDLADPASAPDTRFTTQGMLFEAVLRLLVHVSRERSVVLLLEDLHWADESTLALIAFLIRTQGGGRLLALITYRTSELRPGQAVRRVLPELRRRPGCVDVPLGPLTDDAMDVLVAALARDDPERVALVDRIRDRADGNPFFVTEMLTAVPDDDEIPHSLKEFVMARVEDLEPDGRVVVDVAATAGRSVDHDVLAAAAGMSPDRLQAGLRGCVDRHLLLVGRGLSDYRFRHALTREIVYGDLLPGQRRHHHAAIAAALEQDVRPRTGRSAQLAHHWWEAQVPSPALRTARAAGDDAAGVLAFTEAATHYGHALDLWPLTPDPEAESGLTRSDLLARAADAERWSGRVVRARELVDEALADLGVDGPGPVVGGAPAGRRAEVARLLDRRGRYAWEAGDGATAIRSHELAAGWVDGEGSALQAWVLAGLGTALMQSGRLADAVRVCVDAVHVADRAGAERERGRALNTLGVCQMLTGDRETGIASLRTASSIADAVGDLEEIQRTCANLIYVLEAAGRLPEALDVAAAGIERGRRLGVELTAGGVLMANAASVLVLLGRWDEADEIIARSRTRELSTGAGLYLHIVQADADVARGRFARARHELHLAAEHVDRLREPQFAAAVQVARAELSVWTGDPAGAAQVAVAGCAQLDGAAEDILTLRLCAVGLRALADLRATGSPPPPADDDTSPAAVLLAAAEAVASGPGDLPEAGALVAQCRAEGARLRSRPADWAGVATGWARLQRPHPQAYASWRAAEAALESPAPARTRREVATAAAGAAHRLAVRVGAEPLRREVESLAVRARLDLGVPERPDAADVPFGLTARESQVLVLLVEGRTNRQIARRLSIAEKTASVHVSNLLAKLGVANRGQAAALAHRSGLVPTESRYGEDIPDERIM